MSLPTFPINPENVTRDDAINLVLSSIAMEEVGLSHIINAEGEKLQYMLGTLSGMTAPAGNVDQVLAANESVQKMLQSVSYNQMFLSAKMENIIAASKNETGTTATGGGTLTFSSALGVHSISSNALTENNRNLVLGANGEVVGNSYGLLSETMDFPTNTVYPVKTASGGTITAWSAEADTNLTISVPAGAPPLTAQLFYSPPRAASPSDTPLTWLFVDALDMGTISEAGSNESYFGSHTLGKPYAVAAGGYLLVRFGIASNTESSVNAKYLTASLLLA